MCSLYTLRKCNRPEGTNKDTERQFTKKKYKWLLHVIRSSKRNADQIYNTVFLSPIGKGLKSWLKFTLHISVDCFPFTLKSQTPPLFSLVLDDMYTSLSLTVFGTLVYRFPIYTYTFFPPVKKIFLNKQTVG